MSTVQGRPLLDWARLAAAVLVAAIHIGPLGGLWPTGDFLLTRALARLAVPYFFMLSGQFLARKSWRIGAFCRRTALLYAAAVLLYLPLNFYAGAFGPQGFSALQWLQKLLLTGTFYHLWYLPAALLGAAVAKHLARLRPKAALALAGLLYLVGLGGDSWNGLVAGAFAPAGAFYEALLPLLGGYTRCGLFFAPLFFLLGGLAKPLSLRRGGPLFAAALAGLCAEALWLRSLGSPRHDSMYLLLPLCAWLLFGLLLGRNAGRCTAASELAALFYLLHPLCIVLVRGLARLLGAWELLVAPPLNHFAAVCLLTFALAAVLRRLRGQTPGPTARAWRQIDLAALGRNLQAVKARLGPGCAVCAVVKADAYGHGAATVSRFLQRRGVRHFAVASLAEGIALRRAGIFGQIIVLGWTDPAQSRLAARWRLCQTVADEAHARALSAAGQRLDVQLALDTGMHRLGFCSRDTAALLRAFDLPGLRVRGVFSHLCTADSLAAQDVEFALCQQQAFFEALEQLHAAGCRPRQTHLQASYGLLNMPAAPCTMARVGIALYGVYSDDAPVQAPLDVWPALSLKARVTSVRRLAPGEGAGYGRAFTAARPTLLAAVSIGYADGLPRDYGLRGGQALVRGVAVPVAGRLCMDQLLLDVTGCAGVQPGDVVTLIGRDGAACITAQQAAAWCGTITNELLARLSPRLGLLYQGR